MLRKLSDVDSQQRVRQWGEMRLFNIAEFSFL